MYKMRLLDRFSGPDYAVTVEIHGLYKDTLSVLREKPSSEIRLADESRKGKKKKTDQSVTLSLVLSQQQRAFDRGGRGQ